MNSISSPSIRTNPIARKAPDAVQPVLAWLLVLVFTLCPSVSQAHHWLVYTHSLDNQSVVSEGQLRGREHAGKRAFYLELVHALLLEMGHPVPIRELPLARGLAQLRQRDDVVLFNLSQTPARLPLAHWVGPIWEETDWLYESTKRPTGIQTLADAKDRSVCVLNGGTHDERLTTLAFAKLKRNNSYTACFRMLAAGRTTLVASADAGLVQKLLDAGVSADEVRATPVQIGGDEGYIALSHGMPEQQIRLWREALQTLKKDGRFQALHQRYTQ